MGKRSVLNIRHNLSFWTFFLNNPFIICQRWLHQNFFLIINLFFFCFYRLKLLIFNNNFFIFLKLFFHTFNFQFILILIRFFIKILHLIFQNTLNLFLILLWYILQQNFKFLLVLFNLLHYWTNFTIFLPNLLL